MKVKCNEAEAIDMSRIAKTELIFCYLEDKKL